MSSAWRACSGVTALALVLGCNADDNGATTTPPGVQAPTAEIQFDQQGVLSLRPRARTTLRLIGTDGASARVWLEGDYRDASLDQAGIGLTGGEALVALTAPSAPTTFVVRARAAGATARVEVAVNADGFGTLRVTPTYAGLRAGTTAVTSAFVNTPCTSFASGVPTDGALHAEGGKGEAVDLPSVPAGLSVAVVSRIEHYAFGCQDVILDVGGTKEVTVPIADQPLVFRPPSPATAFVLDLAFEPTPADTAAWKAGLTQASESWLDAFVRVSTDEAAWLIDAMLDVVGGASSNSADEMAANRVSGGWDAKASAWIGSRGPIRTRAQELIAAGLDTPLGSLSLDVRPDGARHLDVTPRALDASASGVFLLQKAVSTPAVFEWSADPDDVASIQGTFSIALGTLLTSVGDAGGGGVSFSQALAGPAPKGIDCAGLANSLVGAGSSYAGCDKACTAGLCRAALAMKADAAGVAIDDAPKTAFKIAMLSASKCEIDSYANVRSFQGTWTGSVNDLPKVAFQTRGKLSGQSSE